MQRPIIACGNWGWWMRWFREMIRIQQFAAAIERLSWVKYGCDAFYDRLVQNIVKCVFIFPELPPAAGSRFQVASGDFIGTPLFFWIRQIRRWVAVV